MRNNAVMHKTYELICQLPVHTASDRTEGLLSKEGVQYTTTNLAVTSVRTPIAVLGIQPKLYTHSNWVGVNPFVYVSSVDVRFKPGDGGVTKSYHSRQPAPGISIGRFGDRGRLPSSMCHAGAGRVIILRGIRLRYVVRHSVLPWRLPDKEGDC
jgi:hypothetical protein